MHAGRIAAAAVLVFVPALAAILDARIGAQVGAQETYPNRPVQMLLGWSPGASVDSMARAVAEEMSKDTGQRFLVVNREGASGTIAFAAVLNAVPDGYTLAIGPTTSLNVAGYMVKNRPFDINSFEPICQTFLNDFTISVREESPFRTLPDLVAQLKKNPGRLSYAHLGPGSIPHLAVVEFLQQIESDATGVPFRGDATMLPALLSGNVDFAAPSLLSVATQEGKVRVLVVFGHERNPARQDLPSLPEYGIAISANQGINGIFAPKGTPQHVIQVLRTACAKAVASASVQTIARRLHSTAAYLDAAEFSRAVREDYRIKGELIRRLNLQTN